MKLNEIKIGKVEAKGKRIAIVLPYFNEELGLQLLEKTKKELLQQKIAAKDIEIHRTLGALELPFTCQKILKAKGKKVDAIIALGIVIRGETAHFDLVNTTAHQGLMQVQLTHNVPIVFGILACENVEQVKQRLSKGGEFALTALLQTN